MRLISTDDGQAVVSLSAHELVMLNNALNETLEALDAEELPARVGATAEELNDLRSAVGNAVDALD